MKPRSRTEIQGDGIKSFDDLSRSARLSELHADFHSNLAECSTGKRLLFVRGFLSFFILIIKVLTALNIKGYGEA